MSSLLSYHIFSFFISNIFENFKFGRNFSKFTAGMGCRLIAVSVKIAGNRRLPIGKENTELDQAYSTRNGQAITRPVTLLHHGFMEACELPFASDAIQPYTDE